jgi:hypothetical protein
MGWIKVIDDEQAEGTLREAYDEVSNPRGGVANILKIHSLHPKVILVANLFSPAVAAS